MKQVKLWVVVAALGCTASVALRADAATNAGVLFLSIAPGARAAAMGEAFVAVSNDATATHYNPAGLGGYPLNNDWEEIGLPTYGTVLDAVAVKNGLPFGDTRAYDLWVLTDKGLMIVGPSGSRQAGPQTADAVFGQDRLGHAANWIELSTSGVGSVAAAIRRYAPFLSEEQAETIAERAAVTRMGVPVGEFEPLLSRALSAMPDGYRDRTRLENAERGFRRAVKELRVKEDRLPELRNALSALPETGSAELPAIDAVLFALENAVSDQPPRSVSVLLNDLFQSPIQAIGGGGDRIYIATADHFLSFDGRKWQPIPPPQDSEWSSETIHCIEKSHGKRVWLGTDNGILMLDKRTWQRFGTAEGLPGKRVTAMAMVSQDDGWVMTDAGLTKLAGNTFTATAPVTANVGDSLRSMLARFLGVANPDLLDEAEARVREINGLAAGASPEAGTSVEVPYQLGIRGDVTALSYDTYRRLWVGTSSGVCRFSQGRWWVFGYTEKVPAEATTATALAEERLGRRATPERVEYLTRLIIEYNGLDADGVIEAGRPVYVYLNPAAAQILDMASDGERLYIATTAGQLEVKPGDWSRYYHEGLERDRVGAIIVEGGDTWFVTDDRVVIFRKALKELAFMYSPWLPEFKLDLYYAYGSYVTHMEGWGTLGLAVKFFSFGEIEKTSEFGTSEGVFDAFDFSMSLSYGTRLSPTLAGGLTGKVIYSRIAPVGVAQELGRGVATAFALDLGLLYNTPWPRLNLGAALSNMGPNITYIDAQQSDPLPRNLAVGFGLRLLDSPFNRFTVVGDINKEIVDLGDETSEEFKQIIYDVGAEWVYSGIMAGRLGYKYDEDGDVKIITAGLGLRFQGGHIDVSYIPSTSDTPLSNTLRYSISVQF